MKSRARSELLLISFSFPHQSCVAHYLLTEPVSVELSDYSLDLIRRNEINTARFLPDSPTSCVQGLHMHVYSLMWHACERKGSEVIVMIAVKKTFCRDVAVRCCSY